MRRRAELFWTTLALQVLFMHEHDRASATHLAIDITLTKAICSQYKDFRGSQETQEPLNEKDKYTEGDECAWVRFKKCESESSCTDFRTATCIEIGDGAPSASNSFNRTSGVDGVVYFDIVEDETDVITLDFDNENAASNYTVDHLPVPTFPNNPDIPGELISGNGGSSSAGLGGGGSSTGAGKSDSSPEKISGPSSPTASDDDNYKVLDYPEYSNNPVGDSRLPGTSPGNEGGASVPPSAGGGASMPLHILDLVDDPSENSDKLPEDGGSAGENGNGAVVDLSQPNVGGASSSGGGTTGNENSPAPVQATLDFPDYFLDPPGVVPGADPINGGGASLPPSSGNDKPSNKPPSGGGASSASRGDMTGTGNDLDIAHIFDLLDEEGNEDHPESSGAGPGPNPGGGASVPPSNGNDRPSIKPPSGGGASSSSDGRLSGSGNDVDVAHIFDLLDEEANEYHPESSGAVPGTNPGGGASVPPSNGNDRPSIKPPSGGGASPSSDGRLTESGNNPNFVHLFDLLDEDANKNGGVGFDVGGESQPPGSMAGGSDDRPSGSGQPTQPPAGSNDTVWLDYPIEDGTGGGPQGGAGGSSAGGGVGGDDKGKPGGLVDKNNYVELDFPDYTDFGVISGDGNGADAAGGAGTGSAGANNAGQESGVAGAGNVAAGKVEGPGASNVPGTPAGEAAPPSSGSSGTSSAGDSASSSLGDNIHISRSLTNAICQEFQDFRATNELQIPLNDKSKFSSVTDSAPCQWLQWQQCSDRDQCTTFQTRTCEEVP